MRWKHLKLAVKQLPTLPHKTYPASHSIIHIILLKMKLNEIEKHTHSQTRTHTHMFEFGMTAASACLQNDVSISDWSVMGPRTRHFHNREALDTASFVYLPVCEYCGSNHLPHLCHMPLATCHLSGLIFWQTFAKQIYANRVSQRYANKLKRLR